MAEAEASQPLLRVRDVAVHFGGIVALDGVSFDVPRGQIVGLIGPNGAGKTTLFNCLSRLYPLDKGDIHFEGASLRGVPIHRIAQLGISRAFPWVIEDYRDPMITFSRDEIVVGGNNPVLRAIASELAAESSLAGPAIDATAAHVVSLLNIALTEITDATETHAIGVLLSPRSAGRPRSRRSS